MAGLTWSEEELRWIEPEPPKSSRAARIAAQALRSEIAERNQVRAAEHLHETTRGAMPSVIYLPDGDGHGNFWPASYARIKATPAWMRRLEKIHTAKRQGSKESGRAWRELDSAASSDALLMNIFCAPQVLSDRRLPALLGVERGLAPEFGYRSACELERGLLDRTEIDMRLGSLLVEVKLTESDFQRAPLRLVERYVGFAEVFDRELLLVDRGAVVSYQLVRGVLAASAEGGSFCVLCDARRPDLIEAWYGVMRAVRSYELRARLRVLTWQEVAAVLPEALQGFVGEKYGI